MLGRRSYHPENLRKCEFTGRLSRNLVRSSCDGLTYDETTVLEKRRQAPALQEVGNERTGSLVVPVSSQFNPRRQLDPITEQEKLQIDKWVSKENQTCHHGFLKIKCMDTLMMILQRLYMKSN